MGVDEGWGRDRGKTRYLHSVDNNTNLSQEFNMISIL